MADDFDIFWADYPRKEGKGAARAKFDKALKKTTLTRMQTTLAWQKRTPQWRKEGGKYIPLPATWLHQERWDDEPFYPAQSMRPVHEADDDLCL